MKGTPKNYHSGQSCAPGSTREIIFTERDYFTGKINETFQIMIMNSFKELKPVIVKYILFS